MNDLMKGMLAILVILYVLSPIDACPGPVDDLLLVLFAFGSKKSIED